MRLCRWCGAAELTDPRAIYCSRLCRQSAFRIRRRRRRDDASRVTVPLCFAYADPPYPGKAARFYGDQPTYAGEVDHAALVASLIAGGYAGCALSTSEEALRAVLPMCPPDARVCPWVKPRPRRELRGARRKPGGGVGDPDAARPAERPGHQGGDRAHRLAGGRRAGGG